MARRRKAQKTNWGMFSAWASREPAMFSPELGMLVTEEMVGTTKRDSDGLFHMYKCLMTDILDFVDQKASTPRGVTKAVCRDKSTGKLSLGGECVGDVCRPSCPGNKELVGVVHTHPGRTPAVLSYDDFLKMFRDEGYKFGCVATAYTGTDANDKERDFVTIMCVAPKRDPRTSFDEAFKRGRRFYTEQLLPTFEMPTKPKVSWKNITDYFDVIFMTFAKLGAPTPKKKAKAEKKKPEKKKEEKAPSPEEIKKKIEERIKKVEREVKKEKKEEKKEESLFGFGGIFG
ncbi:MAG: hypothetical protein DRN49_00785 [Thaumarchaeota archaeon]|nr:MAG: hypothetical protein DRN49_00785 [Nitrososphaerota archaeon]